MPSTMSPSITTLHLFAQFGPSSAPKRQSQLTSNSRLADMNLSLNFKMSLRKQWLATTPVPPKFRVKKLLLRPLTFLQIQLFSRYRFSKSSPAILRTGKKLARLTFGLLVSSRFGSPSSVTLQLSTSGLSSLIAWTMKPSVQKPFPRSKISSRSWTLIYKRISLTPISTRWALKLSPVLKF